MQHDKARKKAPRRGGQQFPADTSRDMYEGAPAAGTSFSAKKFFSYRGEKSKERDFPRGIS